MPAIFLDRAQSMRDIADARQAIVRASSLRRAGSLVVPLHLQAGSHSSDSNSSADAEEPHQGHSADARHLPPTIFKSAPVSAAAAAAPKKPSGWARVRTLVRIMSRSLRAVAALKKLVSATHRREGRVHDSETHIVRSLFVFLTDADLDVRAVSVWEHLPRSVFLNSDAVCCFLLGVLVCISIYIQLASLARGLSAHRDRAVARSFALQLFCAQLSSLSAAHRPWLAARISHAWRALTAGASAPHFAVGLEAAGHSLHTELSASFFALVKALLEYACELCFVS